MRTHYELRHLIRVAMDLTVSRYNANTGALTPNMMAFGDAAYGTYLVLDDAVRVGPTRHCDLFLHTEDGGSLRDRNRALTRSQVGKRTFFLNFLASRL